MPALALASFGELVTHRVSRFELDLSNASLIGVMQSYEATRKANSPKYNVSHVVSRIRQIEDVCKQEILPMDVTDIFYANMIQWLTEDGLEQSTIENYLSMIRTCLRWSTKHNCKVSSTYEDFNIKTSEPLRIALTPDEVSHIAHFDISTIPCRPQHRRTLERVRDQFVMQCCLYQRYSDASRIEPDNFDGYTFSCVQQKTGNKAVVDMERYSILPQYAKKLFAKYNYQAAYTCSINKFNMHLHDLLKHIGGEFDELVTKEEKVNGKVIKKTIPKWKAIASHCARRTAITNGVKNAKTETEIRRCSGHKGGGRDAFQSYICYND